VAVAGGQIFLRIGLGSGWSWAAELERILVLWLGFIGAVVASREGRHIRIDIAAHLLPGRFLAPCGRLVALLAAGIAGMLGTAAVRFVLDEARYGTAIVFGLPSWLPLTVLPIAFFLMAFHFLCHCVAGEPPAMQRNRPDR